MFLCLRSGQCLCQNRRFQKRWRDVTRKVTSGSPKVQIADSLYVVTVLVHVYVAFIFSVCILYRPALGILSVRRMYVHIVIEKVNMQLFFSFFKRESFNYNMYNCLRCGVITGWRHITLYLPKYNLLLLLIIINFARK